MLDFIKRLPNTLALRRHREFRRLQKKSLAVRVDITNCCNIRCIMCSTHLLPLDGRRERHFMPVELFERIARQVFPFARTVRLAWSYEPTLHPDFGSILRIAGTSGAGNVGFDTNGVLLDEGLSRQILLSGIDQVSLSLDGWSSPVFEAIRVGAKRDLVYGNVERFLSLRDELNPAFGLEIDFALMRENAHELLDVARFAVQARCGGFNIIHVEPSLPSNPHFIGDDRELCDPLLREVSDLLNRNGSVCCIYCQGTDQMRCEEPRNLLLVDSRGRVHGCSQRFSATAGDFTCQSFEEIWDSPPFLRLRADLSRGIRRDECATCHALSPPVELRPREGVILP
jgi:MoaA/NifB/PqqE/SkfB family radical SAM enzyme